MAIKRQGGRSAAVNRAKRTKRDDGLSTTPTQYGERSPDYVKQAGDPDWMRSYSEEQIGMMGGRARMVELANASKERAAAREYGGETFPGGSDPDTGETPFFDPSDTSSNQESTLSVDDPISMNEGPTTAPTTYGAPGQGKKADTTMPIKNKKKKIGSPVRKGNLTRRIAKTTGTTRGEARGIMKNVRRKVRRGNTAGARMTLTRALSGGPRGGVPGSKSRTTKARATSRKVVTRIQTRQRAPQPVRRPKTATPVKRRKK